MILQLVYLLLAAVGGSAGTQLFAWLRGRNSASVEALRQLQALFEGQQREVSELRTEVQALRNEVKQQNNRAAEAETALKVAAAKGCNCGVATAFVAALSRRPQLAM